MRRLKIFQKILFKSKINGDCLEWAGSTSGDGRGGGYGRVSIDGGTMAVHRVIWIIFNGPIPPKKQIDHRCKNRRCWKPSHLEMVTHKENQKRRALEAKNPGQ